MRFQDTYIQYGVDRELAAKLEGINLPVTTFRNTSDESLAARYGLSPDEIRLVKKCITRTPIPADTVRELLTTHAACVMAPKAVHTWCTTLRNMRSRAIIPTPIWLCSVLPTTIWRT